MPTYYSQTHEQSLTYILNLVCVCVCVCVSFLSNKESGVTTNKEEDRLQRATLQAEAAER